MNNCFRNVIQTVKSLLGKGFWTEKSLSGKSFLGREISGLERYSWQINLCPGKVSWKSFPPGKGFIGREIFPVEVSGKSFPDFKGCSDWIGTSKNLQH